MDAANNMEKIRTLLGLDDYHTPTICRKCGGIMVFRGVGEYQCEDCRYLDYDDYGKVRNYIEDNRGATTFAIEQGTGVSQRTIRSLIREGRLEIASDSKTFLKCDVCGTQIRSGHLCPTCESNMHRSFENNQRAERNAKVAKMVSGFGKEVKGDDGAKRFNPKGFR